MVTHHPKFNCPQEGMYAAFNLCCNLILDNMSVFSMFSPSYNPEFVERLRASIASADSLPGESNRVGKRRAQRVNLKIAKTAALLQWQNLKSYIEKAYTNSDEQKAKLSEAGSNIYRKLNGKGQWGMVSKLMTSGAVFISENKTTLQARENMPGTFEDQYRRKQQEYETLYIQFGNTGSTNEIQSDAKRKANNSVYDQVIQICKDGQKIFRGDGTMQKQFAFNHLVKKAGYGGTAGITFTLVYGAGKLPVTEADAVSTDLKYTGISNAKGVIKINRMTEGEHTFSISALDFDDLVVTVTLQAGVKSRFEFTMIEQVKEVQEDLAKAA